MAKVIAQTNKDIDDSLLLGYLFFYTIGDIKIGESDLEDIFINNGLDKSYIKKINKVDAFRRATSKSKKGIVIDYNGDKTKAKLEIDEVRCDKDCIIRALGRKVIDESNETLSYETVGRIVFNRDTETIVSNTDMRYSNEYLYDDILTETNDRYDEWSVFHTRDTVRNMSNNVIQSMYPVNLMPSGLCKFIPKARKATLYALQGVIRDLSKFGTDCLFEVIPVIDTKEQRNLIDQSATKEIKEELFLFTQELKDIITAKQVLSSKSAASYIDKFKTLRNKTKEYESLLDSYKTIITKQIEEAISLVQCNTK